jgi:hypothetical protein
MEKKVTSSIDPNDDNGCQFDIEGELAPSRNRRGGREELDWGVMFRTGTIISSEISIRFVGTQIKVFREKN